jgi:hypothetical protein
MNELMARISKGEQAQQNFMADVVINCARPDGPEAATGTAARQAPGPARYGPLAGDDEFLGGTHDPPEPATLALARSNLACLKAASWRNSPHAGGGVGAALHRRGRQEAHRPRL